MGGAARFILGQSFDRIKHARCIGRVNFNLHQFATIARDALIKCAPQAFAILTLRQKRPEARQPLPDCLGNGAVNIVLWYKAQEPDISAGYRTVIRKSQRRNRGRGQDRCHRLHGCRKERADNQVSARRQRQPRRGLCADRRAARILHAQKKLRPRHIKQGKLGSLKQCIGQRADIFIRAAHRQKQGDGDGTGRTRRCVGCGQVAGAKCALREGALIRVGDSVGVSVCCAVGGGFGLRPCTRIQRYGLSFGIRRCGAAGQRACQQGQCKGAPETFREKFC